MPQLRFIDIIISVNTDNNFFSIFNICFLVDGICGIDKISVVFNNSIGLAFRLFIVDAIEGSHCERKHVFVVHCVPQIKNKY